MELYHLHLQGIRDDKWRSGKEFIINSKFRNRLGKKVDGFNECITNPKLDNISNDINELLMSNGYYPFDKMPVYMILEYLIANDDVDLKTKKIILEEVRKITRDAALFKREMAMENFRKDNGYFLPSRLSCIYATDEEGIDYWKKSLSDGSLDIFRIDCMDEVFKTNEIFIPKESLGYEQLYKDSYKYWNPKFKNISENEKMRVEYLVQGKVKVLEKVGEIRK